MRKHIIVGFIIACFFTSCSDIDWFGSDFLEVPNPNQPVSEDFYKTDKDAYSAIVGLYNTFLLEGTYRQWYPFEFEIRGDLGYSDAGWLEFAQYTKMIIYNYEWLYEVWGDNFKAVQKANKILKYVPAIEMDETLKKRYLAEARFFRALAYYNIVIDYGRPPLILEPSLDGQEKPTNSTPEDVYAQCVTDLNNAVADLPWPWEIPSSELGRITKAAALGQLGKMYLLQHDYDNAEKTFWKIIETNKFELVDEYVDNFRHTNEYNKESIFEITFSDQNDTDFWAKYTAQHPTGDRSANYLAPSLGSIGGTSDCQPTIFYLNEFKDTTATGGVDPRRDWSIINNSSQTWYGVSFDALKGSTDTVGGKLPNIWFAKYTGGYYKTKESVASEINRRVIRYADILLMYAECLNELNRTPEAYDYIDMVRQRPSVMIVPLKEEKPNLTKAQMKEQIEHERVVELGGECVRWFDLLRWGYFDEADKVEILKKRDSEFAAKPFRPGLDKYKPLMQTELDLNPNLTQNTGW